MMHVVIDGRLLLCGSLQISLSATQLLLRRINEPHLKLEPGTAKIESQRSSLGLYERVNLYTSVHEKECVQLNHCVRITYRVISNSDKPLLTKPWMTLVTLCPLSSHKQ